MRKNTFRNSTARKIIAAIVVLLALVIVLFGCGKDGGETTNTGKESGAASTSAKDAAGNWIVAGYSSNGNEVDYAQMVQSGMTEDTVLEISEDGSAKLILMGNEMELTLKDGNASMNGMDLYTYKLTDADTLEFDMAGSLYTFVREGSETAKKLEEEANEVKTATATGETENTNADQYTPRDDEIEYKFDGGHCYYRVIPSTEGDLAYIKWLYADCKDLYIPGEIDGMKVVRAGYINGNAENLYFPGTLKIIGYRPETEVWGLTGVKTVSLGYDGYPLEGYIDIVHFIDNDEEIEKITFGRVLSEDEDRWMASYIINPNQCPNVKEVVNMPARMQLGYEGNKALLDYMNTMAPKQFISPVSDKVKKLAKKVTKGADTDEEKLYKISEWICDNISYDYFEFLATYSGDRTDDYGERFEREQKPDDVIENKIGVCEGYARLTNAMCNAVGIPAAYVTGVEEVAWHAISVIYIDGK